MRYSDESQIVKINQVTKNRGTMKKFLKRLGIAFAIVFVIVFANGCYFVFDGQFKATEKINAGKDLNVYETFSAYTMHTAAWLFTWPFYPETAYAIMCSQFHITPKPKYLPEDPFKLDDLKRTMREGDRRRIVTNNYTNDVGKSNLSLFNTKGVQYKSDIETLLNGGYLVYDCYLPEVKDWELAKIHWIYEAVIDYKPGIVTVGNLRMCETVFDYLENKGILKPYTLQYSVWETL